MLARLFALFIVIPILELVLLIRLGEWLGFWPTVALVVLTGILGSFLARREGFAVWSSLQDRLRQGQLPGTELLDGVIVLLSGALLITPGVFTDFVGLLGLLPPTRKIIRTYATKRLQGMAKSGNIQTRVFFGGRPAANPQGFTQASSAAASPEWTGQAHQQPASRAESGPGAIRKDEAAS